MRSLSQLYRISQLLDCFTCISECTKLLAAEKSVITSVQCCGCPRPSKLVRIPTATEQLWKREAHSVSAAEETTFLWFYIWYEEVHWISLGILYLETELLINRSAPQICSVLLGGQGTLHRFDMQLHIASKRKEFGIWKCMEEVHYHVCFLDRV